MAKRPTEKLAAALRANLKRRKQPSPPETVPKVVKDPEIVRENLLPDAGQPLPET